MSVLLVYPTHKNCMEIERKFISRGFNAATYPGRTTGKTQTMDQNCWNQEAEVAERMGLPVLKTICPVCKYRDGCAESGYLGQRNAAMKADIVLCTHKRIEFTGFKEMMENRSYVAIHENPIRLLRPAVGIDEDDLRKVRYIVDRVLKNRKFLDSFDDDMVVDGQSNRTRDEELEVRKERQNRFFRHLHDLADALDTAFEQASVTTKWSPNATMMRPHGIERTIFQAARVSGTSFVGQPWQFMLAAASGDLYAAAIIVHENLVKGARQCEPLLIKRLRGFKDNAPAHGVTLWFNDATLERDRLQAILGCRVHDRTPAGRLESQKKAVQILRDITRGTSKKTFANVVRGVMADRPQFHRVGIIAHRPHLGALTELGLDFNPRIVKSTYFGSGEDRSSNDWIDKCDLIVIAGTPRIPPGAIADYLVQVGEVDAACKESNWGVVSWWARTESGQPLRVETKAYLDEPWRAAYRDLVRAQLVQAIGRGRGILETGCEVIVLSTDECGLPVSDAGLDALNRASSQVLEVVRSLTMENSNNGSLAFSIVSTNQVAVMIDLSPPRTRELLRGLERRGLVRKVGDRGGWALVQAAIEDATPCPA